MIKNGIGGSKTITGLDFEETNKKDLLSKLLEIENITIIENKKIYTGSGTGYFDIYFNKQLIAGYCKSYSFYSYLNSLGIKYEEILSKRLLPDNVIINFTTKTIYIIEIKYQEVGGSVDEKLQTSPYKTLQYSKLIDKLEYKIKFAYILSNWFKKPEYKDTLEYIEKTGSYYFFNFLPLSFIEFNFS